MRIYNLEREKITLIEKIRDIIRIIKWKYTNRDLGKIY